MNVSVWVNGREEKEEPRYGKVASDLSRLVEVEREDGERCSSSQ